MQIKRTGLILLFLVGLGSTGVVAQNLTVSSGGNAIGTGGSASYTIGQIVYTTKTGITGSVAQGVQQPFEISVISGIDDNAINLSFKTYPNPTSDRLTLKVDVSSTLSIKSLSYQLFDITGKLLESKKIEGYETIISMEKFVSAIYFLKVIDGVKEFKTFKIIKN